MGNILEALQKEHDRLLTLAVNQSTEILNTNINELILKVDSLTAERDALQSERDGLRTTNESLQAKIVELEEEIRRLKETPAPAHFTMLAHYEARGSQVADRLAERSWASGLFYYCPANTTNRTDNLVWDSSWDALVAKYPNGMDLTVSPKRVDVATLDAWCQRLPQAWREKTIYAYYQEPEDNIWGPSGGLTVTDFRKGVTQAAQVVRKYGIKNAVELQEWTLDPSNGWGTANGSGESKLMSIINPADIDFVSWSMFEYNLKDRSAAQVKRISDFMNKNLPGVPWEIGAASITVPSGNPQGSAERKLRAELTQKTIDNVKASDARGYAWFDFASFGNRDGAVSSDPLLKAVIEKNFG